MVIKEPNIPNSLIKMMLDLFSHTTTASLFYTNDLLVVIDIITRQLSDLNPDDKVSVYTDTVIPVYDVCTYVCSCMENCYSNCISAKYIHTVVVHSTDFNICLTIVIWLVY